MADRSRETDILYLGQLGGREYYYDFYGKRTVVFVPAYVARGEGEIVGAIERIRVPLVIAATVLLYPLLRVLPLPVLSDAFSLLPFVIISCIGGMTAAFFLSDNSQKRGRKHFLSGTEAGTEEAGRIRGEVRKNTRIVLITIPILLLLLTAAPFLFTKIGTILVFCAYICGWFLLGLSIFSFRPLKRLAYLRDQKRT